MPTFQLVHDAQLCSTHKESPLLGKDYTDVILTYGLPWLSWRVIRLNGEKNIACVLTRRCQIRGKPPGGRSSYVHSSTSHQQLEMDRNGRLDGTAYRLCLAGHNRRRCESSL